MASKKLYFLAFIPPQPVYDIVQEIREELSGKYNTHHALRSPPHITLIPPFMVPQECIDMLKDLLSGWSCNRPKFNIVLNGFGQFRQQVIYIRVEENQALVDSYLSLMLLLSENKYKHNKDQTTFHPHLTIAFKDLDEINFSRAWQAYQYLPFSASLTIDTLTMLEHSKAGWKVLYEYPLSNNT